MHLKFIKPALVILLANSFILVGCTATPQKHPINQLSLRADVKRILTVRPQLKIQCTEKAKSPQTTVTANIHFKPGNYDQPNKADIQKLLTATADAESIVITGYSKSRTGLATEKLALKRAEVVAKSLKLPASLKAQWDNHLSVVGNYPGAIVSITQTTGATTSSADLDRIKTTVEIVVVPVPLYDVKIRAGSLRANLVRIIEAHDHTLGGWAFGDQETEVDWIVPKDFHYEVEDKLNVILTSLTELYGIQGTINTLDKTVDFHTEAHSE